jgi:DNA-binding winged helix-turn-helix (wHTH) protein
LQVGDVQVDLRYRRVLRGGEAIELPQRMFDLLLLFLAEPHVLHTRADLFRRIWPGLVVEDANLSQSVWMLRKALGTARKGWIRTVAKSGYVFEPPTAVEAAAEAYPAALATAEASLPEERARQPATTEPATSAPGQPAPRRHDAGQLATGHPASRPTRDAARWWQRARWQGAVAATLVLALIGAGLAYHARERATATKARPPVAIALIELRDRAAAPAQHWPSTLLNAWLKWKLSTLPEVTLLDEAHLAAGADVLAPTLVLLSTGQRQNGRDTELVVRAQFPGPPGSEHEIELRGTPDEAVALVDAMSHEVMDHLLPTRRQDPWPSLRVDAASARDFAAAFEALEDRDWPTGIKRTEAVLARAPDFGLAQQQLGVAHAIVGQIRGSREHLQRASTLLKPLSTDAARLSEALRLSFDPPQYKRAAQVYAGLAAEYPHRLSFLLRQVEMLNRSGQPHEALVLLQRPQWQRQPAGMRIRHLLALAAAQVSLNDPERARASARKAEALATSAGEGWALERAQALMQQGQADALQRPEQADTTLFERAAIQFEQAGSPIDALYASYQATSLRSPAEAEPQLDALLSRTREMGYLRMETQLLLHAAFQHYTNGEHRAFRERLEQALAVARASDNAQLRDVAEFHLLNEDVLRGDIASAAQRAARLRENAPEEGITSGTALLEGVLAFVRGDFDRALRVMAPGADRNPAPAAATPIIIDRIACSRGEVLLQQGDLAGARTEFARCGARDHGVVQPLASIDQAAADVLAGDHDRARQRLDRSQAKVDAMADGPDRWFLSMQIAFLRTRLGDAAGAEGAYRHAAQRAVAPGYRLIEGLAQAGLAEVAAMQSRWDDSREHIARARALLPQDDWLQRSRLQELDIAGALVRGDREQAQSLALQLDARAHRLGDAAMQVELHDLMRTHALRSRCSRSEQQALVARTGMRGAGVAWLDLPQTTTASPRLAEATP